VNGKAGLLNIQRFSIHDGPGIRTTVFLKGCPLSCIWCHNPESIDPRVQIVYEANKCVQCGLCVDVCPLGLHYMHEGIHHLQHAGCIGCGTCIRYCMSEALSLKGVFVSVESILEEIEKDADYYEVSGGGVTISGGEPFMQPEVVDALIKACQVRGISVYIDTCGYTDSDIFERIAPEADGLLYDLKIMDSRMHEVFTGQSNERIKENFIFCVQSNLNVRVRQVIVPGITDTDRNLDELTAFLHHVGYTGSIDLMIYHRMGSHKYQMLGKPYLLESLVPPDTERIEEIEKRLVCSGFEVTVNR